MAGSFSTNIKKREKSPLPPTEKTVKGKFVYTIVFYVYNARCENVNKVLRVNKFWSHPITGTPNISNQGRDLATDKEDSSYVFISYLIKQNREISIQ